MCLLCCGFPKIEDMRPITSYITRGRHISLSWKEVPDRTFHKFSGYKFLGRRFCIRQKLPINGILVEMLGLANVQSAIDQSTSLPLDQRSGPSIYVCSRVPCDLRVRSRKMSRRHSPDIKVRESHFSARPTKIMGWWWQFVMSWLDRTEVLSHRKGL